MLLKKIGHMRQGTFMIVFTLLTISGAIGQSFEKVVFNDKEADDFAQWWGSV